MQRDWQGGSVNCLDDDALLLLQCDHGARHEWCNLKWLGDVTRLLASERTRNWSHLFDLASRVDLLRTFAHSALLAALFFNADECRSAYLCRERCSGCLANKTAAAFLTNGSGVAVIAGLSRGLPDNSPAGSAILALLSTKANTVVLAPLPEKVAETLCGRLCQLFCFRGLHVPHGLFGFRY